MARSPQPRVSADAVAARNAKAAWGQVGEIADQQFADAMGRLRERAQADDMLALAKATTAYETRLEQLERDLRGEAGIGGDGYLEALDARREALQQEVLEQNVPSYVSEAGKARIQAAFMDVDGRSKRRAALWADDQNRAWKADGVRDVWAARYAAIVEDPESVDENLALMGEVVAASGLDPDEKEAFETEIRAQAAEAVLGGLLKRGDLGAAGAFLDKVEPTLSPTHQNALNKVFEDAISGAVEDNAVALEDQHERNIAMMLNLDGDVKGAEQYLRAHRDEMTPDDVSQYSKAIATMKKGGVDGGAGALLEYDTMRAIESGEMPLSQVDTRVRDMLADGLIDSTSARRIIAAAKSEGDETAKSGLDLLDGFFAQGQFEFSGALAASEAEAKHEFRTWREENSNATKQEAREKAVEIAARYERPIIDALPALGAYGKPYTPEEFNAIAEQISLDAQAGALTAAELLELQSVAEEYQRRFELQVQP